MPLPVTERELLSVASTPYHSSREVTIQSPRQEASPEQQGDDRSGQSPPHSLPAAGSPNIRGFAVHI